jgi:hypothetical protein
MSKHKTGGRLKIGVKGYFDEAGRPIKTLPKVMTGAFARRAFRPGLKEELIVSGDGAGAEAGFRQTMVRAQVPHLVTLLVYKSKFDMVPTQREYFIYAPPDIQGAAQAALMLWRRWEKGRRGVDAIIGVDIADDFPKVDDGAVAEPIDDNFFDETWKHVKNKAHKCAGDPRDPWAFTCLDPEVRIYRAEDFQAGLLHRIK